MNHLSHAAAVRTAAVLHRRGAHWLDAEDLEQEFLLAQLEAATEQGRQGPIEPDGFLGYRFRRLAHSARAGLRLYDEAEFEIPDIRYDPLAELLSVEEAEVNRVRLEAMRNTPAGALAELLAGASSAKSGQDRVLEVIGSKAATPAARARTTQRVVKKTISATQGPQLDLFGSI